MSYTNTVIIPTAGLGSRMGNYTKDLNKALLPYKDKPIIAHIIDQFPSDYNFVIPVGHLADQVMDFCKLAYKDRNITFVKIDDYISERSGTGYTLKQCKDYITGPFWYVPCDTFFNQNVVDEVGNSDCYFVKSVPATDAHLYTMFDIGLDLKIKDATFKKSQPDTWFAFTGLMFIYNWQAFFSDLEQLKSNEFIYLIKQGSNTASLNTWLDFGCPEIYKTALVKSQKFDFTKKDEVTYICNNRVIKWWLDARVAEKKYKKTLANKTVCPENCEFKGHYMAYDFFDGQTLYQFNNPVAFGELLNWLDNTVWQHVDADIKTAAVDFYKTKTLLRINKFLEKYPNLEPVNYVDGVRVKDYQYYLDSIDWDYLTTTVLPGFIHGDLQFDNVVINGAGEFKIIDWRHEFADIIEYGDIYYDLAKMAGGLIINYANIKNHNFNIEQDGSVVTLSIPNIDYIDVYKIKLKQFILEKGWDYKKVQYLIPIIFWNMSPLHTAPFDKFLWYLGIKLFAELEQ